MRPLQQSIVKMMNAAPDRHFTIEDIREQIGHSRVKIRCALTSLMHEGHVEPGTPIGYNRLNKTYRRAREA
ncbi:hypothetical protein [Burkholderia cenocepacia]|uniref:hypothetical protein n=1 Tax=Burkholderia cenocepacia TaxID=95486 RepID=UPI0026552086|nr:hypothetical protein [Burkholderia cenocepacia]MDN7537011.1 hypothetical protein [Burkholderia cenocepacia]